MEPAAGFATRCAAGLCARLDNMGLTTSNQFTTTSLYQFLVAGGVTSHVVKKVWKCKVVTPPSLNDGVNQDHVEGFSMKREFTSTCIQTIIVL
jgi:hypothetical protein